MVCLFLKAKLKLTSYKHHNTKHKQSLQGIIDQKTLVLGFFEAFPKHTSNLLHLRVKDALFQKNMQISV